MGKKTNARAASKGIALVLVSGILVLLAVASTAMLSLVSQTRFQAAHATDQASARLLARSGLSYAAARLFQDPVPRTPPSPENQADDWTYRDGAAVPLERTLNPSYAQTEPYYDLTKDGAFDGVDTYTDVNANGRFDSWSGRLRDRHGMTGGTFVLKVLGESGKINLNGGWLDAQDRNGNKTPDCGDGDEVRNLRYVLLLDNLGQIVNVSSTSQDPNVSQNGAASRLGDLLKERPLGGFRSMEEVRGRLSAADWPKVKDFLTVAELERANFSVLDKTGMEGADPLVLCRLGVEARPLVNLSAASREVLQALVLGLNLNSGYPFNNRWVDPALASKTADYLSQSRFASWYDLYGKLYRDNPSVDPESARDEALIPARNIESAYASYVAQSWANVVFGNLIADEVGGYSLTNTNYFCSPPMSWCTYDIPHAVAPDMPHFHTLFKMGPNESASIVSRFMIGRHVPYVVTGGTLEASLIPREASAFSVDCAGRSGTDAGGALALAAASTLLRVGEVVSARTQEEFENRFDSDRGDYKVIGHPLDKDRTQTEPQFSIDSMTNYRSSPVARYSPFWGTIRLADRSGYRQGERFYVPAWDIDQPLRPSTGGALFRDNFQDVSGTTDFVYQWRPLYFGTGADSLTSASTSDAVFRGKRAASLCCAAAPGVSAPGTYTWLQDKRFALDDGTGSVSRGTIELWTTGRPGGLMYRQTSLIWSNPKSALEVSGIQISGSNPALALQAPIFYPAVLNVNGHPSSPVLLGDWHHLVVAFDSGSVPGMAGYVDGRPDPFLVNDWNAQAINTPYPPQWIVGQGLLNLPGQMGGYLGSEVDELRLYDRALTQGESMARALSPRYWTEERFPPAEWPQKISERLREIPSFTSPLYVFNRPVTPEGARWDGFVPQLIQQAVDGIGLTPGNPTIAPPMTVELLCYSDPEGLSAPRVVPFPAGLWRTGGGWADFKPMWQGAYPDELIPRFRAYRYRVWMDASAVGEFNPETPVFDSVSIVVRTGARLFGLSEQ